MIALTKLPNPVNNEEEELVRLTELWTPQPWAFPYQLPLWSMVPYFQSYPLTENPSPKQHSMQPQPKPAQPLPWAFPFQLPPWSMDHSFQPYPSTQNPTLEQHPMQPHWAEPENPPPPPAIRQADQRSRSERSSAPKNSEKSVIIEPRFPWATDKRAMVHDLITLGEKGIESVSSEVCCTHCRRRFSASYNVVAKFSTLRAIVEVGKDSFNDRAPHEWDKPVLPNCEKCGHKNCVKPVIAPKKRDINWLCLLLGKFVGLCSLAQLKYLCKHTGNHRTGAKDRLVYFAYLGLLKQLDETGPFDALS